MNKFMVVALIGTLMNRVRGGLHGNLREKIVAKAKNKYLKFVIDAVLDGKVLNAFAFSFVMTAVHSLDFTDSLLAFSAMLAGSSFGWGDYIGALGGWRKDRLEEWEPIDQLIENFQDKPKLWGFLGMTGRGLVWGFLLALLFNTLWPILAGSLFGCICYVSLKIGKQKSGWPIFEYLSGAPLWLSCLI